MISKLNLEAIKKIY